MTAFSSPKMHGWTGVHRDARTERRGRLRAWVDLTMEAVLDDIARPCRVVDLSATGMMFVVGGAMVHREPHTLVRYEVHLWAGETQEVLARTVWRRGEFQAARFVALSLDAEQALLDVVSATEPWPESDVMRLELAEAVDARLRRRDETSKRANARSRSERARPPHMS
jgi:hypothetical protein